MVPQGYNVMPAHLCIVVEPRRKTLSSNVFISYSFSLFLSYISVIISIHCLFYMVWKFYHQKLLPEDVTVLSIVDVIHLEAYIMFTSNIRGFVLYCPNTCILDCWTWCRDVGRQLLQNGPHSQISESNLRNFSNWFRCIDTENICKKGSITFIDNGKCFV